MKPINTLKIGDWIRCAEYVCDRGGTYSPNSQFIIAEITRAKSDWLFPDDTLLCWSAGRTHRWALAYCRRVDA